MKTINLKISVERCKPFDTPALRTTGVTASHSTSLPKNGNQVAGYQDERTFTQLMPPFVLSALRSKVYRSMSGVATAVFKIKGAHA